MTYQFLLPRLERVIAGPDTLASLPAEVDRYGCRRALIVTGQTLAGSALLDRVTRALEHRCAGVFADAIQHVPGRTVDALLQRVRDGDVDCLVSLGGGSPIDTTKAAVHAIVCAADAPPHGDRPVHIAIPTTLSAAEYTDVAGKTDERTRIKHALSDPRIAARTVIADPVLTLETPAWLWAASGIRALDHAIETLYSSRSHPISQPLAERAIEMLVAHLPPSVRRAPLYGAPGSTPERNELLAHRGECQMAAWMAVFGITNAGFGLSHMLGHQIGARWNVAHGVTSAIMLPHAMRFMAGAAPERFAPIAEAFGIPFDPEGPGPAAIACAERTTTFIAQFNLPARLRDVSVPRNEIGEIAGHVGDVLEHANVIGRPLTRADLAALLAAAY